MSSMKAWKASLEDEQAKEKTPLTKRRPKNSPAVSPNSTPSKIGGGKTLREKAMLLREQQSQEGGDQDAIIGVPMHLKKEKSGERLVLTPSSAAKQAFSGAAKEEGEEEKEKAAVVTPLSQRKEEKIKELKARRNTIKALLSSEKAPLLVERYGDMEEDGRQKAAGADGDATPAKQQGDAAAASDKEQKKSASATDTMVTPAKSKPETPRSVSTYKRDRARRLRNTRNQRRNLFITGFGSFGDIAANPTQQIVEYLEEEAFAEEGYDSYFSVLHVSCGGVDDYLEERRKDVRPGNVNVHIGVNGKATRMMMEKFCYNNKDFRIPDSSGAQPEKEPIDADMKLERALVTDFNLTAICKKLRAAGHDVAISDDPGRYLCNYIYFASLQQQEKSLGASTVGDYEADDAISFDSASKTWKAPENTEDDDFGSEGINHRNKTIFIHVPPFEVVPKIKQIAFIKDALHLLCDEDACDRMWVNPPKTDSGENMCNPACATDFFDMGCKQN